MVFIRLIIILNWHGGIVFLFAKQIYKRQELAGLKGDNSKSFQVHWIETLWLGTLRLQDHPTSK